MLKLKDNIETNHLKSSQQPHQRVYAFVELALLVILVARSDLLLVQLPLLGRSQVCHFALYLVHVPVWEVVLHDRLPVGSQLLVG